MNKHIKIDNFKVGYRSLNGRIYSEDTINTAIDKFNSSPNRVGYFQEIDQDLDTVENLLNIKFLVNKLWADDSGVINASITTINGFDHSAEYSYSFLGEGIVRQTGEVEDFEFNALVCYFD